MTNAKIDLQVFHDWLIGRYLSQHGIDFTSDPGLLMMVGKDAKELADDAIEFLKKYNLIKN